MKNAYLLNWSEEPKVGSGKESANPIIGALLTGALSSGNQTISQPSLHLVLIFISIDEHVFVCCQLINTHHVL